MAVIAPATRPPVHDSAVAHAPFRARASARRAPRRARCHCASSITRVHLPRPRAVVIRVRGREAELAVDARAPARCRSSTCRYACARAVLPRPEQQLGDDRASRCRGRCNVVAVTMSKIAGEIVARARPGPHADRLAVDAREQRTHGERRIAQPLADARRAARRRAAQRADRVDELRRSAAPTSSTSRSPRDVRRARRAAATCTSVVSNAT